MSFLTPIPALIATAITVPLLVALYFLKLRRRSLVVPSTLLWRKAVQDLQVNAPFQRLRNSLLLWLQLLLLALLLFALARPADEAAAVRGDRVAILIDRSASMAATDDQDDPQTRLEQAQAKANEVIDNLASGASAMVVEFADRPRVRQAFTTDRAALRRAVTQIQPSDLPGNLHAALDVLGPMAGSDYPNQSFNLVVISDGRFHTNPQQNAARGLPGVAVTYLPVGLADPPPQGNVGFVAADARRNLDDPNQVEVFARLTHAGSEPRTVGVQLFVDDQLQATQRLQLPGLQTPANPNPNGQLAQPQPGQAVTTLNLQLTGAASIELRHDAQDALAADNVARLALTPSRRLRVLIVSPGNNPFLAEALRAVGVERLDTVSPQTFQASRTNPAAYDIVVLDRWSPPNEPPFPTNTLSFAATPNLPGFRYVPPRPDQADRLQTPLTWNNDEPAMQHVALDDVLIRGAGRLTLPPGGRALAMGLAGPLIAQVDDTSNNTRHLAVAFDLRESRWPLSWSYQVFIVNAVDVLGLATAGDGTAHWYATQDAISIPLRNNTLNQAQFTGPHPLNATVRAGRANLPVPERAGWYDANPNTAAAVADAHQRLAVNLLDPAESDLRAAPILRIASSAGPAGVPAAQSVRREWWPWLLLAALGLLCLEWVVYVRRVHV